MIVVAASLLRISRLRCFLAFSASSRPMQQRRCLWRTFFASLISALQRFKPKDLQGQIGVEDLEEATNVGAPNCASIARYSYGLFISALSCDGHQPFCPSSRRLRW